MKRNFARKIISLLALAIALASCADGSDGDSSPGARETPLDGVFVVRGTVAVDGAIPRALSSAQVSGSRAAFPSVETSSMECVVAASSAQNGTSPQTAVATDNGAGGWDFEIPLSSGTWTLKARCGAAGQTPVLKGEESGVVVAASSVPSNLEITLSPSSDGTGSVALPVKVDADSGIQSAKVALSPAPSSGGEATITDFSQGISFSGISAGAYTASVKFYEGANGAGRVLFAATERINVFGGMTTDTWVSDGKSAHISGNNFHVTAALARQFLATAFYVRETGSDSAGDGSFFNPFATVQSAVGAIESANDGSTSYTIFVSGTIKPPSGFSGSSFISMGQDVFSKDVTILIKSESESAKAAIDADGKCRAIGMFHATGKNAKVNVTLENIVVTGGNSSSSGGGIRLDDNANLSLTLKGGVEIKDNNSPSSTGGGGGIYSEGKLTIEGSAQNPVVIENNTTGGSGGGLSLAGGAGVAISGAVFKGNYANANGGGVNINKSASAAAFESCSFMGNSAGMSGKGGAIYIGGISAVTKSHTIKDCAIGGSGADEGNSAKDGGGVYVAAGALSITGGEIRANSGGGVVVNGATVSIDGAKIAGNKSLGGLYAGGAGYAVTFKDCDINGNTDKNGNKTGAGLGGEAGDSGTLKITGATKVGDTDGDFVYLPAGTFITVDGALTGAHIKISTDDNSQAGTQVLAGTAGAITDDVCAVFHLASGSLFVKPNGDGSKGVLAAQAARTDFYVSSSGSDTTGDGAQANPFASMSKAIAEITGANDGASTYVIHVSGEILGSNAKVDIPSSTPALRLKIQGADKATDKLNRNLASAASDGQVIKIGVATASAVSVTVAISGLTITGGNTSSDRGGGVCVDMGADVTITDCAITGNKANGWGGGLSVKGNKAKVKLTGTSITGNTCKNGAGIHVASGYVTLEDCEITGNAFPQSATSGTQGKGVSLAGGELNVKGGVKVGGPADDNDIYLCAKPENQYWVVTVAGALSSGAYINVTPYVEPGSSAAGAVVVQPGATYALTASDCAKFHALPAASNMEVALETTGTNAGKGVIAARAARTDFYVSSSGSDTTGDGASANPFASVQSAVNAALSANDGASEYTIHILTNISGTDAQVIVDPTGTSKSFSLTIKSDSGKATLDAQGTTGVAGPVISQKSANTILTLKNLIITGGLLTNPNDCGAGVFLNEGMAIIEDCEITGNAGMNSNGGGVYIDGGVAAEFVNCSITGNSAMNGAGVYTQSDVAFKGCEITGNSASVSGAGVYANSGVTISVEGETTIGSAACVNDIYLNGSSSHSTVSLSGALGASSYIDVTPGDASAGVTIVESGDTEVDVTQAVCAMFHLHGASGMSLVVSGTGNSAEGVLAAQAARTVFYVKGTGGTLTAAASDTTGDGTSAKPFASVNKAMAAVNTANNALTAPGSVEYTILIDGETSDMGGISSNFSTATITPESALTLKIDSANAPQKATIKGSASARCMNASGASYNPSITISNIVFTGGNHNNGGGVFGSVGASGTLLFDNCEFTGNSTTNGGGVYISSNGVEFKDCAISGNTATTDGGGVFIYSPTDFSLKMSGDMKIGSATDTNDVCLKSGQFITVTGALSDGAYINVTPKNTADGTKILEAGDGYALTASDCAKFHLQGGAAGKGVVLSGGVGVIGAQTAYVLSAGMDTSGINIIAGNDYTFTGMVDHKTFKAIMIKAYYVTGVTMDFGGATMSGQLDETYANLIPNAVTEITLPKGITKAPQNLAKDNKALKTVKFSDNALETIGKGAFYDCTALQSVDLPSSVTAIDSMAFYSCASVTAANLEDTAVATIGSLAYYDCGLTSVTLPSTVTSIGAEAFKDCASLSNVDLSACANITSMGTTIFQNCAQGMTIKVPFPDEQTMDAAWGTAWKTSLPYGATIVYKLSPGTTVTSSDGVFSGVVNSDGSVTVGGFSSAQMGNQSGGTVDIPSSVNGLPVTKIADGAFDVSVTNVQGIRQVNLPSTLKTIGDNAFKGCSGLSTIDLPDGLESIGDSAFSGCLNMNLLSIPNKVKSIGMYAFQGCQAITQIIIPDSVKNMGGFVFQGCNSLQTVSLPSSTTSLPMGAFQGCSSLTSVCCSPLNSNDAPTPLANTSLNDIGADAFNGCGQLSDVPLPATMQNGQIGARAFQSSGITNLTIPAEVKHITIGNKAFDSCSKLSVDSKARISAVSPSYTF